MYVLKKSKCEICEGDIEVIAHQDEGDKCPFVSHGECIGCGKAAVLPQEPFFAFVQQHCEKY